MPERSTPLAILDAAYTEAASGLALPFISNQQLSQVVEYVCQYPNNRAPVRLLLACCLAKIHDPSVDIRKPYTELGERSFSGRTYDETFIGPFVTAHELPCNSTTAFLTPAFRTNQLVLEPGIVLGGRPKALYDAVIELLHAVETEHITALQLLTETIRYLLLLRNERIQRMQSLLSELRQSEEDIHLSSEDIVTLIEQHLRMPRSARLPVLVVAAAYRAASPQLGEQVIPLQSHNAADEQTGALGDLEVTLVGANQVVTTYEMKMKTVTRGDIDRALQKLQQAATRIDNYIFITTAPIDDDVTHYAESRYRATGGIEFVILDCVGFLRHFLHLFHRLRLAFLESYQDLLLNEPESAVRQELKEAFLAMRRASESSYSGDEM